MTARYVKIEVDAIGNGIVELDGHDISESITGANINVQVGEITQVALLVKKAIEFEGFAEIVQVPMGLSVEALDRIPLEVLHNRASELPWGNSNDLVANVLAILREMIPSGD